MLIEQYLAHLIQLTEKALNEFAHVFRQAQKLRQLIPYSPTVRHHWQALSNSWPNADLNPQETQKKLRVAAAFLHDCLKDSPNPEKINFEIMQDLLGDLCLCVHENASIEAVQHTLKCLVEQLYQIKHALSHRHEWKFSTERGRYENTKLNFLRFQQLVSSVYKHEEIPWASDFGYDPELKVVWCRGPAAIEQLTLGLKETENPYHTLSRMLHIVREPSSDRHTRETQIDEAKKFLTNLPAGLPTFSLLVAELKTRIVLLQSALFNANVDDLLEKIAGGSLSLEQFHHDMKILCEKSITLRAAHHSMIQSGTSGLPLPLFKEYVDQFLQCFNQGFATLTLEDIHELPMTRDEVIKLRDGKNCIPDDIGTIMQEIARYMNRLSFSEQSRMVLFVFQLYQRYQFNLFHVKNWTDLCRPLTSMSMFDPVFVELCDTHPEPILFAYTELANPQIPPSLDIAQKALFRIFRVFRDKPSLPIPGLLSLALQLQKHYKDFQKEDPHTDHVRQNLQSLVAGLKPKAPPLPTPQDIYDEIYEILKVPARNVQMRVVQSNLARKSLSRIISSYPADDPDLHKIGMLIVWFEFRDTMLMFDALMTHTATLTHNKFQNELRLIKGHCPEFSPNKMLKTLNPSAFEFETFEQYIEMNMTIATLRLMHIHPKILAKIPPCIESVSFLRESSGVDPKHLAFIMKNAADYVQKQPEAEQARVTLMMFRQSRQHHVSIWNSPHTKTILEPLKKLDIHSPLFEEACDQFPSSLLYAYSLVATASSPKSLEVALAALTRIVKQRYDANNFDIPVSTLECLNFARRLMIEYQKLKNPDQQFSLSKLITTLVKTAEREKELREQALKESFKIY